MSGTDARIGSLLIQHSRLLVAVVDRERNILRASARFEEVFGPVYGRTCRDICVDGMARCAPCPVDALFEGGDATRSEQTLRAADGSSVFCEISAMPLDDSGAPADQVLVALEDRTRVTELLEEIARSDRLANVGLTAAGLAHTIKNILGGMEGAMYTVETGLEKGDEERLRAGWEMVANYIGQVNALVLNLLDYTKPTRPDRQETDPGTLVAEVLELFESKAALVGVELCSRIEDSVTSVQTDRPVILACLSNLVTNALDACMWDPDETKSSRVTVATGSLAEGGVYFEVRDNGVGISEENQSRVLSASFTTKGIRGTGLGLLLTRKAVEQHGGRITFGSMPGEGSWFRFVLPGDRRGGEVRV